MIHLIIARLEGGTGNQLYQYATGRRLAQKWNTELKLDINVYKSGNKFRPYNLKFFNIKESIATPEEISAMKKIQEPKSSRFSPEVLNYPDNVYLQGFWQREEYFADIRDILLKEFTLKQPLGSISQRWKEKILAAENSVSLHFRHGDFIYHPSNQNNPNVFGIAPLSYYYQCIEMLKRRYKNLSLFIFSDDLEWTKKNLRVGGGVY